MVIFVPLFEESIKRMAAADFYIIVNPHSGSGKTMSEWSVAQDELKEKGIEYVSVFTLKIGHAKELSYKAAVEGYRKIIAVGGDGTLHEVFCGVGEAVDKGIARAEEFFISVIPIGSGNDWVKAVGIPRDTKKAVEALASPRTEKEDYVRVRTSNGTCVMANVGGLGFDSHVCERVNSLKSRGMRSKRIYINSLLYTILHLNAINIEVIADGEKFFSGECYSIAFGNGEYSGGGMRQTPGARIGDGLLDVLLVPKVSLFNILREIPRLFKGNIDESKYIKFFRCREVSIVPLNAASADIVEVDGEIEGRLPLTIQVSGEQFKIPAKTIK